MKAQETVKNLEEFREKWQNECRMRNHTFTYRTDLYESYSNIKFIVKIVENSIYCVFFNETFNELLDEKMKEIGNELPE